jgi:hypothetical protein
VFTLCGCGKLHPSDGLQQDLILTRELRSIDHGATHYAIRSIPADQRHAGICLERRRRDDSLIATIEDDAIVNGPDPNDEAPIQRAAETRIIDQGRHFEPGGRPAKRHEQSVQDC